MAVPLFKDISEFLGEKTYLIGDYMTWTDFYLFEFLMYMDFITDGEIYKIYPNFLPYYERIASFDLIKKYMESDKYLKRPFNSLYAAVNN